MSAVAEVPVLPEASVSADDLAPTMEGSSASAPPEARFNLTALVRGIVAESESTDLGVLADEVFDAIDPRDYGPALRACLRATVREEFRQERRRALAGADDEESEPVQPPVAQPPDPVLSAKVRAIRSVRALLEMRVNLGEDQHKHLGDCTVADLSTAAQLMRVQAARSARRANQYDNLAVLLNRHQGRRVSDLPGELLLEAVRT